MTVEDITGSETEDFDIEKLHFETNQHVLSDLSFEFKWATRLALEGRVSTEDIRSKGTRVVLEVLRDTGQL